MRLEAERPERFIVRPREGERSCEVRPPRLAVVLRLPVERLVERLERFAPPRLPSAEAAEEAAGVVKGIQLLRRCASVRPAWERERFAMGEVGKKYACLDDRAPRFLREPQRKPSALRGAFLRGICYFR